MTKEQIKQALISIVVGACTIFLVSLLEGLLDFVKSWMAQSAGGVVAGARYFIKNIHYLG